ncbi:MAG TPA: DUF3775 domain-containing protein [Rhizomicrobium sp.]|nr:DUF3775 domain-containing protein [Rhizomicrobium sp.]
MPIIAATDETPVPDLDIAVDKVAFIIVKAREFDEKEADSDPDEGSNAADDGEADVLEDKPEEEDATQFELTSFIRGLNDDEKAALVALAWVGRGTYGLDEWDQALQTARDEHKTRTAEYLLGLPMLGDYLEEGLDAFGESISDENETL